MDRTDARSGGEEGIAKPTRAQVQQLTAFTEVPDRPALAPNVQLAGEMQGTGFKDRQWLIQRGDQFIQVTELLYRVAEQANGERTLEEIAERVTRSTEWMVSAANVRQLIQIKLIPAGLIAPEGGAATTFREGQSRSPLGLNLRMKAVSPRIIGPATKVLQVLYAPYILVSLLLAIGIAHGWLYFIHGVANSVADVLYTPGLMLIILAILISSGIFHEFGHAAALRYGGGKVRGMGVGIYLVYPAFYTDVTDSYRLGRWSRVRTDLGGFYFHLIFALGLMGLYLISGQEFLLLVVLLIDLNILYQCLPFVRFDGYWALADLTGLPDFFSQMGPFIKSVLPVSTWKRDKLPDLKPWVKAVFASYIIVTVPILSLLLFFLITNLPSIMATLWDAIHVHVGRFSIALTNRDFLGMGAAISQIFLLALEMLGIVYLLYTLCWRLIRAIWNRSKPTSASRAT